MWPTKAPQQEEQAIELTSVRKARNPEELVEVFSDEVWRFASSQLSRREDAEDVMMEVFQAAFAGFHKFGRIGDQRLWLLAIARKKVASLLRKRYRRAELPLEFGEPTYSIPANSELQDAVRTGINALPTPQAEALVLKYVNGLSTAEVSAVIGKSLPATNSLLQRARGAFREALDPAIADYARSI
jgi:RNA polymerase sigma-70 factor, ECF subfamily